MPESDHITRFAELKGLGEPFVAVTLVDAHGSTPSDAGSKMIVRAGGHDHGTVGGGSFAMPEEADDEAWKEAETRVQARLAKRLRIPARGEFRNPFKR